MGRDPAQKFDSWVRVLAHNFRGRVIGAVVDHENVDLIVLQCSEPLQACSNDFCFIQAGNHKHHVSTFRVDG